MRKIFSFIILGVLVSACKQKDDKTIPTQTETGKDSIKENHSAPIAQTDSDLAELFSKNKSEIILKLKSLSKEEANALYEKYYEENGILLGKIDEKEVKLLDKFYSENEADKKEIKLLDQKLAKHQLQFDELGEGYVEITTKSDFYYAIFRDYVTPDYKEYLLLKSDENKMPYSADAGLIITFKHLGDRIISWENFMNKYPNSKLIPSVKEEYKNYQMDYLIGQDNTPTYEKVNDVYIYPENIQEFNRFEKKYPKSPTVSLIHIFKENFKNENIPQLLRAEQEKLQ